MYASTLNLLLYLTFFLLSSASSVSMVQLSSSPFGYQSPSGRSEEGREGNMKSAKPQVNHSQHGESQRAMSPLQSALSSAASPSQAYETYIDNGLICLKHKIRNIEKKKVTFSTSHPCICTIFNKGQGTDVFAFCQGSQILFHKRCN